MSELLQQVHYPATETEISPPLVIAHGLFGSARNWNVIAKRLSGPRRVIAVDMRNHGDSFWATPHDYAGMASDLRAVMDAVGQPVDLLGHSMGGKAAMIATLEGAAVNRLIVADIAPVAYTHDQTSNIDAMKRVDLSVVKRRSDADAQLAADLPEPALRAFFLQSLDVSAEGARWKLNLDALKADIGAVVGFPETAPDARFDGETLFLRGEKSDYVQTTAEPKIKALFPEATIETVPDAGHWLHAEKPREFVEAVESFLS